MLPLHGSENTGLSGSKQLALQQYQAAGNSVDAAYSNSITRQENNKVSLEKNVNNRQPENLDANKVKNQNQNQDKVTLSPEGKHAAASLTEEQKAQVQSLKDRDREVKIHEQAHAAVGGQYAGSPSYEYETGPDGKRYVTAGEVSIDVSAEEEPKDTIQKMQTVRAAALAPAEPSTQDLKVAAEASQKESEARAQVSKDQLPNTTNDDEQIKPLPLSSMAQMYTNVNVSRAIPEVSTYA